MITGRPTLQRVRSDESQADHPVRCVCPAAISASLGRTTIPSRTNQSVPIQIGAARERPDDHSFADADILIEDGALNVAVWTNSDSISGIIIGAHHDTVLDVRPGGNTGCACPTTEWMICRVFDTAALASNTSVKWLSWINAARQETRWV